MATYTTTYSGIPVSSNVPFNTTPSAGHYRITLNYSLPFINVLELLGYDLTGGLPKIASQLESSLTAQGSHISNMALTTPGNSLQIDFDASSPPILIVLGVIVGIGVIGLWLLEGIAVSVEEGFQSFLKSPLVWVVAGAGVIGLGVITYSLLTDKKTRSSATGAVRGGFSRANRYLSGA